MATQSSAPSSPMTPTKIQEPEPKVGDMFNGSKITKIQVEITDRGGMRFKKRFIMTLEGGMMAMDDRYITKAEMLAAENDRRYNPEDSASSLGSFTFEGMELPESAMAARALKEQKEREREERRKQREERGKKPPKHSSSTTSKGSRPPPSPKRIDQPSVDKPQKKLSLPRKPSSFKGSNGSVASSKKKVAVVSKLVKVFPESAFAGMNDDHNMAHTTWKFPKDAPQDTDIWSPIDVSLLPAVPDDENIYDTRLTSTTGLWGYVPKADKQFHLGTSLSSMDSSFSSLNSKETHHSSSSKVKAKDVWVYPPNTKVPNFFPVHGTYKLSKKSQWPPPVDAKKKQQRRVGRLKSLPNLFAHSTAKPMNIQVYSKRNEPDDKDDDGLMGVWTYLSGQEQKDDEWIAQDVQLFPPGQSPKDYKEDLAQGMWVLYDTDDENDKIDNKNRPKCNGMDFLQPNDPDNRWIDSKQQPKVHLFAPGQEPNVKDEAVVATGIWTFAKESSIKHKWPPPTKKEFKRLQEKAKVGKVVIPKIFQQQPRRPLTVYSKACPQRPSASEETTTTAKPKPQEPGPVTGQWTFFDGNDQDANGNWEPVQIEMYAPGEAPPDKSDAALVQGIWTIHDSDPEQVCVHPPSYQLDETDDSILASGIWTFYDEERIGDDGVIWAPASWPPPSKEEAGRRRAEASAPKWTPPGIRPGDAWESYPVTVVSAANLQKQRKTNDADPNEAPILGIWAFNDAPNDEADSWLPQDLVVYPEVQPSTTPKGFPTGIWGIHAGAEPDQDGLWAPDAVWFFTPGDEENIPKDFIIQGTWAYPPRKKKIEWPPKTANKDNHSKKAMVGKVPKLPKWDPNGHGKDWKPQKVSVVPGIKGAPVDGGCTGVWGFKDGREPENLDDWGAMDVLVYPKEAELEADGKPMGIWGYHKDAVPDDNGEWSSSDVIFCAPGENPSDNMTVQGKWTFFDVDQEWPAEPFHCVDKPAWDPNTQGKEWKPQKVSVIPRRKADPADGTPTGVWGFKDGQEPDNLDEWNAIEVLVYPKGVEPDNDVDGKPIGIWGYHKGATSGDNGDWAAEAIVFCAPGEDPNDDILVQGKWTFFDSEEEWPAELFNAKEIVAKKKRAPHCKPPLKPKPITPVSGDSHVSPKMKAKRPVIVPDKALMSPLDRAKMRVQPIKSPTKAPMDSDDEDSRHIPVLGKYQSAFDAAIRPSKPRSMRSMMKKKYKK